MKSLLLALTMAFSFSALAWSDDCVTGHDDGGRCEDDKYFYCFATDGDGVRYKNYSYGWFNTSQVQTQVFAKCKRETAAPGTCRPAGCVDKY